MFNWFIRENKRNLFLPPHRSPNVQPRVVNVMRPKDALFVEQTIKRILRDAIWSGPNALVTKSVLNIVGLVKVSLPFFIPSNERKDEILILHLPRWMHGLSAVRNVTQVDDQVYSQVSIWWHLCSDSVPLGKSQLLVCDQRWKANPKYSLAKCSTELPEKL